MHFFRFPLIFNELQSRHICLNVTKQLQSLQNVIFCIMRLSFVPSKFSTLTERSKLKIRQCAAHSLGHPCCRQYQKTNS